MLFFFFKQKTAYEMRISDWSSDVCSSDLFHELLRPGVIQALGNAFLAAQLGDAVLAAQAIQHDADLVFGREVPAGCTPDVLHHPLRRGLGRRFCIGGFGLSLRRSEERRVGTEFVRTCGSRWWAYT